jgi:hypothetical protein
MLSLVLIVIAVILATWAGWALWRSLSPAALSPGSCQTNDFLARQVRYQATFLLVAVAVAGLAYAVTYEVGESVFGVGVLSSVVEGDAFGLGRVMPASWSQLGIVLTLAIGLVTCILVAPSLRSIANWSTFLRRCGVWTVALAAVNALSEELIYRGAVVAAAQGHLEPWQTALLSAALFSAAHIRGQASGAFVVAGSAIVGWCLAHAVLQTHGLFWAWCVHFTQDVVMFAAFFAETANLPLQRIQNSCVVSDR